MGEEQHENFGILLESEVYIWTHFKYRCDKLMIDR